jgi:hypothetical protein
MNHSSVKHKTVMANNITSYNNVNHTSVKPEINSNGQQYNQPQQYEPLLSQTSNSDGQRYSQLQQYEPLLYQTSNSNDRQYNQPQQYETLLCET